MFFVCNFVNSVFFRAQDCIFLVHMYESSSEWFQGVRKLLPRATTHSPLAGNRSKDQLQVFTEYSTYCFYCDPLPLIELLRLCYLATGAFEIHSDIGSPRAFSKQRPASDKTSVLWQTSPLSALLLFRFLWIFFFIIPQFPFLGGGPLGGCVCGLKYSRHQGSDQLQNLLKQGGKSWWKERRQRSLFQCVQQSPKNPERFLIFARTQW